ncbi:MAG: SAM-dependent methyltransferase [Streptosporangiaceae bacterium]
MGGKDNFAGDRAAGDRAAGDRAIEAWPEIVFSVRANRAFLTRVVRYLAAEAGIRQFLDIGTGIPSANNTHEVAQAIAPGTRVVYVDNDPTVLAHARALLTSGPHGVTDYIDADLRDTGKILDAAARTLDFTQPVAITLMAIVHLIGDEDDPYGIIARLMSAVPSGSYLAMSHIASDINVAVSEAGSRVSQFIQQKQTYRTHDEVLRFFDGLELVQPGLAEVQEWRPDSELEAKAPAALWGGVGRKK